jgi:hypothetical protein
MVYQKGCGNRLLRGTGRPRGNPLSLADANLKKTLAGKKTEEEKTGKKKIEEKTEEQNGRAGRKRRKGKIEEEW